MARREGRKSGSKRGKTKKKAPLRRPPRGKGISEARPPEEVKWGDASKFIEGLIGAGNIERGAKRIPPMRYGGREIPMGMAISTFKKGTGASPREEKNRGGFRNLRALSRPPDSSIVPLRRGFDSRHHVFQLPGRVALKYYRSGDAVFGPTAARREAENLTFFRKGLFIPTVRPLRDDLSAGYSRKRGRWRANNRWARLFTKMPADYVSLNRLDFGGMSKEERRQLMEELGFAMGYMHRRRGIHGDPTLANILVHRQWRANRFSPENVMYVDGESFGYAGDMPDDNTIKKTFADDVRTVSADARRLGLLRDDERRDMLRNRFWNAYMANWRAGKPSRLEPAIVRVGPGVFFRMPSREADYGDLRPQGAKERDGMRARMLKRLGIRDD